jgi:hypothetical protein
MLALAVDNVSTVRCASAKSPRSRLLSTAPQTSLLLEEPSFWRLHALYQYLSGAKIGWGDMKRKATWQQ